MMLLLLFSLPSAKQPAVSLHELAHQEEGIDGGDAIADEVGNELALAIGLLGHS